MNEPRTCACGCEADMTGRRIDALYASDACRARGWKRERNYGPQKPRKSRSNGNGRSGRQVSYPKAVETLTRYLIDEAGWKGNERMVRAEVRDVLARALPERQR